DPNNVNALRKTLSHAIEVWDRTSKRYRDKPTNDEAWKPDFDKVTDSLLLASAQLSRNESMDSITAQLKTASDTIQGIRTRHSIPVYRSELSDVIERLETLQASLEDPGSLRKRAEDAAERLKEVLEAWQAAKATFMENNTADLPPGQLIQVRALAAE